ncbi:MAG: ribosome-associated translation inhibitor RaiA [Proteobacteria bacterium]|nr:ribosome-associated translation inhibitor RaiA [Pseudomonadota bacterium]
MRYQISGKQIDVGESLTTHVRNGIGAVASKFAQRPTEAQVTFSKDAHEYRCESTIHLSTGLTVAAEGRSTEIYDSFEKCADKIEKQLRRYKRRLKDHHKDHATPVEVMEASAYILASEDTESVNEPESLQPVIIAEMETKIQSLSVGEAVMQMELTDEPVLVFRNEGHKRLNVVYKRKDGNIGWVDPTNLE